MLGQIRRAGWLLLPIALAALFALRALALVEVSSLWGDELSTARKAFQPSLGYLLGYLREDTHPPRYYFLLWSYGRVGPQAAWALRGFSWLAYLLGGITITALVARLAAGLPTPRRRMAIASAIVLAFCSPFPVRFSIEAKGYALLVLGVALSLLSRCRWLERRGGWDLPAYAGSVAVASLTHYYGLFHGLCLVAWDLFRSLRGGDRRRAGLAATAAVALLPALGWIVHSRRYLFAAGQAGDWIGRPDWAMAEDTLARLLGPAPLPKLALILVAVWLWRRWPARGKPATAHWRAPAQALPRQWLDAAGIIPGLLLLVGVVGVSFFKPLAFPRYFVVLLPAVVAWVSVGLALQPAALPGPPRRVAVAAGLLVLLLFWHDAFLPLDPPGADRGSREQNDFRRIVLLTRGEPLRLTPRPHHFLTAERLLLAGGQLASPGSAWRDTDELGTLLAEQRPPPRLVLAETSGPRSVQRRIAPALERVEARGYRCRKSLPELPHIRLLVCELAAEP